MNADAFHTELPKIIERLDEISRELWLSKNAGPNTLLASIELSMAIRSIIKADILKACDDIAGAETEDNPDG